MRDSIEWLFGYASCDATAAMQCEACNHSNVDGARFCAKCGNLMPVADEAAEDKLIGQIIGGRYRVTGVLGEGGMGIVYVGEQQMGSSIRQVAIKTLHQHLSKDPSVLARFHRECGTVAQLEHPNTIKFYDFGSTADGTLYIAMEFVKGKPLNDVIEGGGPMPPERVMKIMKQICGALDEAHKQGIIHRDLKPENVILTDRAGETDFVKVLDFGIAARSESADAQKEQKLTQQGMVLGTPPYMSPEQFTGKALDARSDIYSLGVMTYEMLTSKLPFEADTPWQWATQHMTAQPLPFEVTAPAREIPEHIRKAILRAMSKNREERQETAKDFYADLSHGGGITVVEAPRSEVATQGTAAMAAAPDFAAFGTPVPASPPVAPAQSAPGVPPAAVAPVAMAPMAPMPPAHVPMAPPRQQASGGGKGLVIGLAALGIVLLLAIVVVAVAKMKPSEDEPLANPFNSSGGGATTIAPIDSQASGSGGGTNVDPGTEDASTTPTAKTTTTATTKPTASTTGKGVPNAQACDACLAAAQSGNIGGAAGAYNKCTDPAKKSACSSHAKARAPAAARAAAMNGNCAQAKGIQSAASAMGAGSGALNNALNGTKCK